MASDLMSKLKKSGKINSSEILSDSIYFVSNEVIHTDLPILNVAFSGKLDGGLTSGVTVFAGESKTFKCCDGSTPLVVYEDKISKIVTTYKEFYNMVKENPETNYYVKIGKNDFSKIDAAVEKKSNTYKVSFYNGMSIIVGDKHAFMDMQGNSVYAEDLKNHDKVKTIDGFLEVKDSVFEKENSDVYDISIAYPHWYTNDDTYGLYHHNTMLGVYSMKAYLDKYEDAVVLFYDSEFGMPVNYLKAMNIDTDRVIHIPVTDITELRNDIVSRLESIERGDKVFILIDSIGNLASRREFQNAIDENEAKDMSRAGDIKSLFRIITPHITMKDIPCVIINHIYMEQKLYGRAIVSGGCLVAGTKILMANGEHKNIEDIQVGEKVKTIYGNKEVLNTWNPDTLEDGKPECIKIIFSDGYKVTCSKTHKFMAIDGTWKEAKDITDGFELRMPDDEHLKVVDVTDVGKKKVYDIMVKDAEHYFLENGVCTHNSGVIYSSNTIFIITKSQEKQNNELVGYNFTINIEKSRYVKERSKLMFTVLYDSGISKYSGLMDLALESGDVIKPSNGWYCKVNTETGEVMEPKMRMKDTYTEEFWKPILESEHFQEFVKNKFCLS